MKFAGIKLVANGDDGCGEQQLKQRHAAIRKGGKWQTNMVAHSKIEQWQAENCSHKDLNLQRRANSGL
ncbi:unnamed protein product, partial [marine sediment metagenome]